jgi:hypothetical protein
MTKIKIKFTTSVAGPNSSFSYGETVELSTADARGYLQAGYAEPVHEVIERAVKKRKK